MNNDSAHVGTIPCIPPTCHQCGLEWKDKHDRVKTRLNAVKNYLEALNNRGGLGMDIHNELAQLLTQINLLPE